MIVERAVLNNYRQSRFFSLFLKAGLIFILGVLLINFFFFNHYFNSVNSLQQATQINQTAKNKILVLNEKVTKTQKMAQDMLKSSASKSSYYVNAIIQGLANTILLNELNYQPLSKKIKAKQPIQNNINTILVSGNSNSSEAFSKWIASLESFGWIINVEILNY